MTGSRWNVLVMWESGDLFDSLEIDTGKANPLMFAERDEPVAWESHEQAEQAVARIWEHVAWRFSKGWESPRPGTLKPRPEWCPATVSLTGKDGTTALVHENTKYFYVPLGRREVMVEAPWIDGHDVFWDAMVVEAPGSMTDSNF